MLLVAGDGVECGQPGLPVGAVLLGDGEQQEVWGSGEEVEYRCEEGRVMAGEERRSCGEEGTWSGAPPLCSKSSFCIFAIFRMCRYLCQAQL